ncbi:MAG TPA: dTMP kinase [Clostridiaceae bacterium]|nr:dTMP kinase [Clostridiaceae bacterium]
MGRGLFITVEGTDGSGKTTQIGLMKDYLERKGYSVVLTREPGGTYISEKIRAIILDPANSRMSAITEMILYAAARAQLVSEVIKPALESGRIVICDRFVDSSYAYQGFGRGIDLEVVESVNKAALDGAMPDITFFFDISPEIALNRRIEATGTDRIEREDMEFHMRVYNGYKQIALLNPERIRVIDSNRTVEEISKDVIGWIDRLLK